VDWLCTAFGFEKHAVIADDAGRVEHAQLVLPQTQGHGMIMVSPVRDAHDFDRYQGPAADRATQSSYVVVRDADAHHAHAVESGAKVVLPITDEHGGRLYSCLDLEGHLWNFGTYDPWQPAS
jgi:uncharacterized glyoxalase superfamily protein PhnB